MLGMPQSPSPRVNRRGPKPRPPVQAEQLIGSKYLPLLQSHLHQLRRLYPHPNRLLFYDDVVLCYLLAFFNLGHDRLDVLPVNSAGNITHVEMIAPDGSWQPVAFTKGSFHTPLNTAEPKVFRVNFPLTPDKTASII